MSSPGVKIDVLKELERSEPYYGMSEYRESIQAYKRGILTRNYHQALHNLDFAITICPVDEALPTLMAWRDDLEPKTRKKTWWQRFLGI